MPIFCEVLPRRNGSALDLQELGAALLNWVHDEVKDEGGSRRIDPQGLAELCAGRMPQALSAQSLTGPDAPDHDMDPRSVRLVLRGGPTYDRRTIIQGLRRAIIPDLVDDVLIAGITWQVD